MLTVKTHGAAMNEAGVFFLRRRRSLRDLAGLPETLARVGGLELKLAVTTKEIRAVQKMRYRVFFDEGGAIADPLSRAQKRDKCPFDRVCDHLIVVDHEAVSRLGRRKPTVVGAYRVLRQKAIPGPGYFYTAGEFDVAQLIARHPDKTFLELGRSCVLPEYRARRVVDMLWRGLLVYVLHHRVDVMFGCASLPGADPRAHAEELAFLRSHARASDEWRAPAVRAPLPGDSVSLDAVEPAHARRTLAGLPPLIKGYLRLGASFGEEIFVDRAFGTTDVFVVLPVANIDPRYIEHFGGASSEAAAA